MEKLIDLHTHSTASDGSLSPEELVAHAAESGLSAVAVSDHDNTDGIRPAMREGQKVGIEVVPAIELSAKSDTETHILGYFIDPDSLEMKNAMKHIREVRVERISETCELLEKYNIHVTLDEVKKKAGSGILCRAHIAKIMTEKGYVSSPREAFARWMNVGCPAYSDAQAITDEESIELITKAGGDAYLAHLHLTKKNGDELDSFVKRLKNAGLCGIEGYYTDYTPDMEREYRTLAEKYELKISGGTDFHGAFKPHISIGRGAGNLEIPYSVLEKMRDGR